MVFVDSIYEVCYLTSHSNTPVEYSSGCCISSLSELVVTGSKFAMHEDPLTVGYDETTVTGTHFPLLSLLKTEYIYQEWLECTKK